MILVSRIILNFCPQSAETLPRNALRLQAPHQAKVHFHVSTRGFKLTTVLRTVYHRTRFQADFLSLQAQAAFMDPALTRVQIALLQMHLLGQAGAAVSLAATETNV